MTRCSKTALKALGNRHLALQAEAAALLKDYEALVKDYAPELLDVHGVGPDVAAALLTVTGENVDRITSESALAHLYGAGSDPRVLREDEQAPAEPGRKPARQRRPSTASLSAVP